MNFIVLLSFLGVVAASPIGVDWNVVKTFDFGSIIRINPQPDNEVSGRITNGEEAAPKQFPYQVGLMLFKKDGAYWCGGSIISDRWVLTAAHCTDSLTKGVYVYLGAWNRRDPKEPNQHIIFVSTEHVIVHEKWNTNLILNDISLIKLPVAIEFNDCVQPVNLPKISSQYSTYVGDSAIASGWGKLAANETANRDILRWIKVPVMKNSACNRYFFGSVKPTMICTKTKGGTSTCNGDSGGPLVLADGSRTLIGLTSFGAGSCEIGFPAVFTRITSYLDWISEKTGIVNT